MPGFETRAIHEGQEPDPVTGSVVPAIHLASTYRQSAVGAHAGFEYARTQSPTRAALERQLTSLEEAGRGFCFSSGLAAEDAILRATVSPGDTVVLPTDAYGGTYRLIDSVHGATGVRHVACDLGDEAALEAVLAAGARLVWLETPSNPTMGIVDVEAVAARAHAHGALVVVDNTFATPYLQQPLALGADVVVHSTTKYLGGHSDVLGGFAAVDDDALGGRLAVLQNSVGAVPGPFDCYLVARGAKTLAVRMDRHCANARAVAQFLVGRSEVAAVLYPGLPDAAGHDVAKRQMRDFGGMVSFLHAGGEDSALAMVARTEVFTLAESLGGVESLIEHPARMTHASVAGSALAVDPALVRLSVGLETIDDLLGDLDRALGG